MLTSYAISIIEQTALGQSTGITDMQTRLTKQIAAIYPTIRTAVNQTLPQFLTEAFTALSYQLAAGTNTLNNYGLQDPLMGWIDFLHSNVKGLTELPDAIADFTGDDDYNLRIDFSTVELMKAVTTIYPKAAKDYETKACQGRIFSSMSAYTDSVSKNITDSITFLNKALTLDAASETKLMRQIYADFHRNITVCSTKRPLSVCRTCMLNLVTKRFLLHVE